MKIKKKKKVIYYALFLKDVYFDWYFLYGNEDKKLVIKYKDNLNKDYDVINETKYRIRKQIIFI